MTQQISEALSEAFAGTLNINLKIGGVLTVAFPQGDLLLQGQKDILAQLQTLTHTVQAMSQTVSDELKTIMDELTDQAQAIADNGAELSQLVQQLQANPNDPAVMQQLQTVADNLKSNTDVMRQNTAAAQASMGGGAPTPGAPAPAAQGTNP